MTKSRTIKAIPITYRSQLEHDWAMYFARHNISFTYEPKYFGEWLPDFELEGKLLIEVKPNEEIRNEEIGRKHYEGMSIAMNDNHLCLIIIGTPDCTNAIFKKAEIFLGEHHGIIWTPPLGWLWDILSILNAEDKVTLSTPKLLGESTADKIRRRFDERSKSQQSTLNNVFGDK